MRLANVVLATTFCLTAIGCSSSNDDGKNGKGKADAGGYNTGSIPFSLVDLDTTTSLPHELSIAAAADGTVAVAYFTQTSSTATDFQLKLVKGKGATFSAPVTIATVQRMFGVSAVLDGSARAHVAYLAGNYNASSGGGQGSAYWFQSDAAIAHEQANGSFQTEVIATNSSDAALKATDGCSTFPDPYTDFGYVVGLHPALAYIGSKFYLAWRDGHDGSYQTDAQHSDLELAEGNVGNWTRQVAGAGCLQGFTGLGTYNQIVAGIGGEPAILHQVRAGDYGGPLIPAQDLIFTHRKSGAFTTARVASVPEIRYGGSQLAYDAQAGYGIAWLDQMAGIVKFTESADGITFKAADPLYGAGTGGRYLSLTYTGGQPAIFFYVCDPAVTGQSEAKCPATDELRVAVRTGADWVFSKVDDRGGYWVRAVNVGGKMVVAYRDPASGAVRLAREQ